MGQNKDKGFTLLEIMIAIVILSLAIVPATGMFSTAQFGYKMGSDSTTALGEAQRIMEECRIRRLQGATVENVSRTAIENQPDYYYTVDVIEEGGNSLITVRVTVYYPLGGQERELSLVTRMGDAWR